MHYILFVIIKHACSLNLKKLINYNNKHTQNPTFKINIKL